MRPMRTLIARLAFATFVITLPAAAQETAAPKAQSVLTPGDSVRPPHPRDVDLSDLAK